MISSNQMDFMMILSLIFSVAAGYFIFVPEPLKPKYYYKSQNSSGISEFLPYAILVALIFILFRTNLRRYKIFAVGTTIFILFAILYLGIHWITDMIGGIILAFIAYFIATRIFKTRFKDEDISLYMR